MWHKKRGRWDRTKRPKRSLARTTKMPGRQGKRNPRSFISYNYLTPSVGALALFEFHYVPRPCRSVVTRPYSVMVLRGLICTLCLSLPLVGAEA